MKTIIKNFQWIVLTIVLSAIGNQTFAQGQELQQLLLNIEKLTQLKSILADMKTGYQIYQQGYGTISGLSKGNFNLHDTYLTGLYAVNPNVKNYVRVAEIISQEASLLSEYKSAFNLFKDSGSFQPNEISFMSSVYEQLIHRSLANIEELTNVLTAGNLRMSDAERIKAIDRIYESSSDKLDFLRDFNRRATILNLQRLKEKSETNKLSRLYGLNN